MRIDLTDYMGSWPKALMDFVLFIVMGHLLSVFFAGVTFLSTANLVGCTLTALAVWVIAYRQKRAKRQSEA